MLPVKPAGPSTRAKAKGKECPQCGKAMVVGVELGEAVLSCGRCGQTFERAVGRIDDGRKRSDYRLSKFASRVRLVGKDRSGHCSAVSAT